MGTPNVYPMGTTIYNPEKAWNGYTLLPVFGEGAVLIDMNGNVVKTWKDLQGFPNKLLPKGQVFGSLGMRNAEYAYQDMTDLVQVDWDGNIIWQFNKKEEVEDGEEKHWVARQHHDFQREGNPVGYYVPGMDCKMNSGNTLLLCHENVYNKRISEKCLLDDVIIEVDWDGNIVWRWQASQHFNELGFSEMAKTTMYRNPNDHFDNKGADWMHINSMSTLGPNIWYEQGDERFHPDNIIWDARESNITAIISKETGKIVWKIGPDFSVNPKLRAIGQLVGQHHAHMIPKGLPGEGNILIFDNGGWAGYGAPSNTSKDGTKAEKRDYSRVLEIDPISLRVVWEFTGIKWGGMPGVVSANKFYSQLVSSAQRLPNGNTLITEGCSMRIFEVTANKELVWEYIAPFDSANPFIYRAYRYPYSYVPQLPIPKEIVIERIDNKKFRVPGAAEGMIDNITAVQGTKGYTSAFENCVV